jgi:hypothetical protein
MLVNLLMAVGGLVLLGAVGVILVRRRGQAESPDEERDDRDVAPVLYVPRPRNNLPDPEPERDTARRELFVAGRVPTPALTGPREAPLYVAPLSDAADGVVQLWPGRLEPVASNVDEEIRFIRTPGINRFTFGRSPGPANSHIQLLAPTASRQHAYMVIENGRWRIGNMSETNRVVVNGELLASGDADRWLHDGDRIELGEVSFVFRER